MKHTKKGASLYGFEGYKLYYLSNKLIDGLSHDYWCYQVRLINYANTYAIAKNLNTDVYIVNYNQAEFRSPVYKNHKELLNTASKIYIHPNCKISRTAVSSKYKKVLNPWAADVAILPAYDANDIDCNNDAIFVNEKTRSIFLIELNESLLPIVNSFQEEDNKP